MSSGLLPMPRRKHGILDRKLLPLIRRKRTATKRHISLPVVEVTFYAGWPSLDAASSLGCGLNQLNFCFSHLD